MNREEIVRRAQTGQRESKTLDFKREFDVESRESWCEIIKDIVAFANSGGGAVLLGANDDGSPAGVNVDPYLNIDPADLTNKVSSYTGYEFSEFEIIRIERAGQPMALFAIFGVAVPMVFTRDGAHVGDGRARRPTFVKGSIYFRHGAKSEPANSNDLRDWLDRTLENVRNTWLGGIRKVVETGAGQAIQVVTFDGGHPAQINARLGNDPDAVAVRIQNPEEQWPLREAGLIERVLAGLPAGTRFNGHDVRCIKLAYGITPENRPEYVFKPHRMASPQYSEAFATWILAQVRGDDRFLEDARDAYRRNNNRYD